MHASSVGPAFSSESKPVLPSYSPVPSVFPFPSRSRAAPHPSPAADVHCFLHGPYCYPSVGTEVLQGSSKMARAKVGNVITLNSATTSLSLIHNDLWELLSEN